jgi:hypothetical protein
MGDLIYTRENCLPADLCKHIIKKFEDSQDKGSGISGGGLNHTVKKSTDLMINSQLEDKEWSYIYDYLREYPWRTITGGYSGDLSLVRTAQGRFGATRQGRPHMQMQRYVDEEGYYAWHYENYPGEPSMKDREMAFMWYLNDVSGGGETEFRFQKKKVEPKAGSAAIFPAFWTHMHRGNPPSEGQTKYIITGWIESIEPENVSLEFSQDYFR